MKRFIASYIAILLIISTALAQSGAPIPQNDSGIKTITIPAGTVVQVELQNPINSKLSESGDLFNAHLTRSLIIEGSVALKKGTEFQGSIVAIKKAKMMQRQASMNINIDRIITAEGEQPIETMLKSIDDFENEKKLVANNEGKVKGGRSGSRTLRNVLTGTGLGTVAAPPIIVASSTAGATAAAAGLGGAMGGGALIGLMLTKGDEINLRPGTILRIEITKPITVQLTNETALPQQATQQRAERQHTPSPRLNGVKKSFGLNGVR